MPLHASLGRPIAEIETLNAALVVGSNTRKEVPLVNHRLRKAAKTGASVRYLNAVDYPLNYDASSGCIAAPQDWVKELAGVVSAAGGDVANAEAGDWHKQVADELKNADNAAIVLGALAASHPRAAELRQLAVQLGSLTGAVSACCLWEATKLGLPWRAYSRIGARRCSSRLRWNGHSSYARAPTQSLCFVRA